MEANGSKEKQVDGHVMITVPTLQELKQDHPAQIGHLYSYTNLRELETAIKMIMDEKSNKQWEFTFIRLSDASQDKSVVPTRYIGFSTTGKEE